MIAYQFDWFSKFLGKPYTKPISTIDHVDVVFILVMEILYFLFEELNDWFAFDHFTALDFLL